MPKKKKDIFESLFGKSPKKGYEFTSIKVEPWHNEDFGGIVISWSARGIGFGEVTFSFKNGKIEMDTECMSNEFVLALLAHSIPKLIKLTKRIS